jgi:hypothetical protein
MASEDLKNLLKYETKVNQENFQDISTLIEKVI